ncbi:MAG: carbohydrate ABC transporter permease [Anaerorhabdus sp.]
MKKIKSFFDNIFEIFSKGDIYTRLSFIIMGSGSLFRKQFVRGFTYLAFQVLSIMYLVFSGFASIVGLKTLGTVEQGKVFDEARGIYVYSQGDNSMLFLLFGVFAFFIIIALIMVYIMNINNAYENQKLVERGKKLPKFKDDIKLLLDSKFHISVLTIPTVLTFLFTVLPLIFMILIAFTNFDSNHQPPGNLFTWVGMQNFKDVFGDSKIISGTFVSLLQWTLIWAVFATFLNYILGMLLAILINSRGVKIKKFWRTIFVVTIAVPQFVSLLLMSQLLADGGSLNVVLMNMGIIDAPIKFLTDGLLAKITVVIINCWVGIPYSMLITTGILMNIPSDMYESAKIDGATSFTMFRKITMPYMLSVTTPYLITQFVANINNFNVIYLLTKGGPLSLDYYQAGKTDLLVTWLYKLTVTEKNYSLASTLGIIIFIICSVFSLIIFRKTLSQEEGKFN